MRMNRQILERLLAGKIVAILRGFKYEEHFRVMEALLEEGIDHFEVTLNTPGALEIIEEANKQYGNRGLVGAGTVKNGQDALAAIKAGAQFLIAPNLSEDTVRVALEKDILIVPGVFSPTEIVRAYDLGCEIVKLFPAVSLGCEYIRQVKAPLDGIKIMAVGGITIDNARQYLAAGADGVGVGSALILPQLVREGDDKQLKAHFKKFREVCRQ